jgi:hypothetical protein
LTTGDFIRSTLNRKVATAFSATIPWSRRGGLEIFPDFNTAGY